MPKLVKHYCESINTVRGFVHIYDHMNFKIENNSNWFFLLLEHDAPPTILIENGTHIDLKNK